MSQSAKTINCQHWQRVREMRHGGRCAAGHYGGRPSYGVCQACPHRSPHDRQPRPNKPEFPPKNSSTVKDFIKAVSSKYVDKETFNKRLAKCTAVGGYTWAKESGSVTYVSDQEIKINDISHPLPEDEIPFVKLMQTVQKGQIIAQADKAKPCPYLKRNDRNLYCGACGCAQWKLAELKTKLWFSNLVCPRTPPLFTSVTVSKKPVE